MFTAVFFHSHPELETIQIFICWQTEKQIVVCLCNGILLNNNKGTGRYTATEYITMQMHLESIMSNRNPYCLRYIAHHSDYDKIKIINNNVYFK